MDTERQAPADLALRGREVVASYLPGVDVAWADDDEDLVEILNVAGRHRRIRVSATDGDTWLLPRAELDEEPEVDDGWWSFVRIPRAAGREPEVYLARENEVRALMLDVVAHSAAADPTRPVHVEVTDEAVPVRDRDVMPLLRSWHELTKGF
ncbi:hypothetical protein GCM10023169_23140 [Georgenia halophila]|uniref:Uncharacterized protein n=1 Tax=Georgenia halophila TaxID=620889 RepID=A0ABP8LBT4_9MICO